MQGRQVRVTEPSAVEAVVRKEVDGEVYADGEVWADEESLRRWAMRLDREQSLEGGDGGGA
jgi:hypothetical protein